MQIDWPDYPEHLWERITPERIKGDAFLERAVRVETQLDGNLKIGLTLVANICIAPDVLVLMRGDPRAVTELILQRLLVDYNLSLLPLMLYRFREHFRNNPLTNGEPPCLASS